MGQDLPTYEQRVQSLLGSPPSAVLSDSDIDQHVYAAVRKFSLDRPRLAFVDYTGDGVSYTFAIPSGWVDSFSWVDSVEYPQGERPPITLDQAEVQIYPGPDAPVSILLNFTTPAAGKKARVFYSIPYPLPTSNILTDLIPDTSYEYVAKLAASAGAMQLAGRASPNVSPQFPAASLANVEGEETRWLSIATAYRKEYDEHVGTADGPAPASVVIDWDAQSSQLVTARRWLFRWPRR